MRQDRGVVYREGTVASDGRFIVTGGSKWSEMQVYDPVTKEWSMRSGTTSGMRNFPSDKAQLISFGNDVVAIGSAPNTSRVHISVLDGDKWLKLPVDEESGLIHRHNLTGIIVQKVAAPEANSVGPRHMTLSEARSRLYQHRF